MSAAILGGPLYAQEPVPPGGPDFINRFYPMGRVNEVTRESITIESPGYTYTKATWGPGPVRVLQETQVVVPDQPPKRFRVSATLAAGGIPREPRNAGAPGHGYRVAEIFMYRLTDVKKGDWVGIIYARVGGVDTCDHINIFKRPGGRIPPLPPGVQFSPPGRPPREPYHVLKNAYWDQLDRDNPHPEKLGNLRPLSEALARPLAPDPREAPRREVAPVPRDSARSGM